MKYINKSNKKKRYGFVPEEYREEYEKEMLRQEREERHKEYEKSTEEFTKKSKRIKQMLKGMREIIKKDSSDFRNNIKKVNVDYDKVYSNIEKKDKEKLDQNITSYLIQHNAKKEDAKIITLKNGNIIVKYLNKDGERKLKKFTKEELMSFNQKNREKD